MDAIYIFLGFTIISISTWLFLYTIKIPDTNQLFSREFALSFRSKLEGRFGTLAMMASLFGTLTSLATVYVFFLGTSKVFGVFVLFAPFTLFLGYIFTNFFTKKVLENNQSYAKNVENSEVVSAVIATITWQDTDQGKKVSNLIKWISILSISGLIWLEFSIFADIASKVASPTGSSLLIGYLTFLLCSFTVLYIIFRYGLRGFIFADLVQSPLIIIGTFVLFLTIIYAFFTTQFTLPAGVAIFKPLASPFTVFLFVLHVFVLNLTFVLVTEGHWFRLWLFNKTEIKGQKNAVLITSVTWGVLALVGCLALAFSLQTGNIGFVDVINKLSEIHPVFILIFWLVASAALFSTADAQIFHLILLNRFDKQTGKIKEVTSTLPAPSIRALRAALLLSIFYLFIRYLNIPFEKLVFSITPLCSNILPAIIAIATRRPPPLAWTVASLIGYCTFSFIGLSMPSHSLSWTIASVFAPIACSILMFITTKELKEG